MKKWSIALLMGIITMASFAQVQRNAATKKDSAEMAMANETTNSENGQSKKETKRQMIRSLNLSKEQKQKFKEIHQANKEKKESISGNDQLTESQKKDQLKELHKEATMNMNSILSEEQRDKMKAMREGKKGGLKK